MWRIWRVYGGVTRGEMESISRLHLHYTTLPHYPSTSLQWTVFLQETCLIMFILVPHAMCLYLICSYNGAINARPVQGNHQDVNNDKQLLSTCDCSKPCNQIIFYGTSDHYSSHKSVGVKSSKCHSLYDHKHLDFLPKPPEYKWGSEKSSKETNRQHLKTDVARLCKRNGRLHMLLSYSVLQALGWGSVLAFSWTILKGHSLYHHSKQQCPTEFWKLQPESNIIFDNEPYDQLLKICENNDNAKDKQVLQGSYSKRYDYNQIFNPDIDRSLFSYLYSVASTQPVIASSVNDKQQTSKRIGARKKIVCHQSDVETVSSEESAYSKCYSLKLESDTQLYQPNNDLQQTCLSKNFVFTKVEPCVNDLSTVTLECSANNKKDDVSQSKFDNNKDKKKSREIVTIEDCSESGISSAGSNEDKKNDSPKHRNNAEDVQKLIQRELDAIRAVQNEVNGLLERDLGLSVIDTDPETAILHFQAGAWLGDPDATYNLGLCLHMGKGVKQNYKLARKYYSQASKAGHGWASYNLAVLVSSGLGGSVDNDVAYSLLLTAAERDVKEAKEAIRAMQEEEEEEEDEDDLVDANHSGIIASGQ